MIRKILLLILIELLALGQIGPLPQAYATNESFVQTDWSGGASSDTAVSPTNKTGWTKYSSKDTYVTTPSGKVTLTTKTTAATDDTDTDFATGTLSNAEISGTGASAVVKPLATVNDPFRSALKQWGMPSMLPQQFAGTRLSNVCWPGGGNYLYLLDAQTGLFLQYDLSNKTWRTLGSPEKQLGRSLGHGVYLAGDPSNPGIIYVVAGGDKTDFLKYTISTNTWETKAPVSAGGANDPRAYYGASMTPGYDGSGNPVLYLACGGATNAFLRYNIATNNWTTMQNVPVSVDASNVYYLNYSGAKYVYCFERDGDNIYKFNVATGTWVTVTTASGFNYYYARANMAYPGAGDILYIVCGGPNAYKVMMEYNLSTNTYISGSQYYGMPHGVSDGGSICFAGNTGVGATSNKIYLFQGRGINISYAWDADMPAFDTATQKWDKTTAYGYYTQYYGSDAVYVSGVIYAVNGADDDTNGKQFFKYTIANNRWEKLAPPPFRVFAGGCLVYDPTNNRIWLIGGQNGGTPLANFAYYSIAAGTWTDMTAATSPPVFSTGAGMVFVPGGSGAIYATQGNNGTGFYKFDIATNTWTAMSSTGLGSIEHGGDLIYPGAAGLENYIYCVRGNAANDFYRYSISGNSWTSMASVPATLLGKSCTNVEAGGDLAYNNGYIYLIDSLNGSTMQCYNISANNWEDGLGNYKGWWLSDGIAGGGAWVVSDGTYLYYSTGGYWLEHAMTRFTIATETFEWVGPSSSNCFRSSNSATVTANGSIYMLMGENSQLFFKYTPSTDTWEMLTPLPVKCWYIADLAYGGGDYIYCMAYANKFYRYSISTNTWTQRADCLYAISDGLALAGWDANTVYATTGGINFLKYDNTTNSWSGSVNLLWNSGLGTNLIKAGSYVYALRAANSTSFARFDGNNWTSLASTNNNADYGASMVFAEDAQGNDYIFMINGANYTNCERYSISGNSWTSLIAAPERCDSGSKLFYPGSGDIIYLLPICRYYSYVNYGLGNVWTAGFTSNGVYEYSINNSAWNTTTNAYYSIIFRQPALGKSLVYYEYGGERYLAMRQEGLYSCCGPNTKEIRLELYDIDNHTWTDKGPYHAAISPSGEPCAGIVWPGHSDYDGYLYILYGYNTNIMYKYSLATGQITSSTAAPATIWGGSYPVYPGSGDYFYMFRGNNTRTFYRFNMATALWDDAGAVDLPAGASVVNGGGCLGAAGGTFYHVEGNSTRGFWSWTPGDGSWSQKAYLPWNMFYGASLVYPDFGDYIYCFRGRETRDWARYSISGNTWTELSPLPFIVSNNASCAYDPVTGEVYIASGYLSVSIKKMNLAQIGTYLSDIKQIGNKVGWENATWANNATGNVSVKVRSSASSSMAGAMDFMTIDDITKGSDMTDLSTVTDTDQYIQYQVKLAADDLSSLSELNSISLNYINYPSSQTLISSAYDTTKDINRLMGISWTESLEESTDIKFQFRTAGTQAGLSSASWLGPTGDNTFVNDFLTSSDYAMDSRIKLSGGSAVLKADLEDMQYKQAITIDNSAGGALTPMVARIDITSAHANFWSHVQTDGDDVRFYDGTNKLSYFLPSFDYSGQTAKFYVKMPSIGAGEIKTIYMLYGSAHAASESDALQTASFPKVAIFCQTVSNSWMTAAVKETTRDYMLANLQNAQEIEVYNYNADAQTGQPALLSWMAANQSNPCNILVVFDIGPYSVDSSGTNDYDQWIDAGNMVIWTGDCPFYVHINTAGGTVIAGWNGAVENLGTGIVLDNAGAMTIAAAGSTYTPSLANYTSGGRCGLKTEFAAAGWNSVLAFADDSATHDTTDAFVAKKTASLGGYYAQFYIDSATTGAQRGAVITEFIDNWAADNCASPNIAGTLVTPESETANTYSVAGTYTTLNPVIQPVYGAFYNNDLSAFTATQTTPAGTAIKYQVSPNGYRWYYYTGSAWAETTGGYSQTSTSTQVNSNLSSFMSTAASSGEFFYRAYLSSTAGTATPSLSNIDIVTNPSPSFYIDPLGGETINSSHADRSGDRWFQYRLTLYSMGMHKPTLDDVTVEYLNPLILNSWDLNMNAGTLTLHFNQTANASTFSATGITIQDASTATTSRTLTAGSTTSSPNGVDIVVNLSTADLNAIKANGSLAKAAGSSWLRMTAAVIDDMLGNDNDAIANGAARQVTTYTPDTTSPQFSSWTLNMNTKVMSLTFNEPVKASTITVTAITIQDAATGPSRSYPLTNSTHSSTDGTTVTVTLSATDYNAIVELGSLATGLADSYITMTSSAVKDMATTGNNVVAVTTGMQASAPYTANSVAAQHFKITTSQGSTMTAGDTKVITIKAYDASNYLTPVYAGDRAITFGGASSSPDPVTPAQAINRDGVYVNFATPTTITFDSKAAATTTIKLYCKETAGITASEGGKLTPVPLSITVSSLVATKLAFSTSPSGSGTINIALSTQPKVKICDTYGNKTQDTSIITLYDSSTTGSYTNATGNLLPTVNPTATAVDGEATFTGVTFDTVGTIYLYAQCGILNSVYSNAITFSTAASTTVVNPTVESPITAVNMDPTQTSHAVLRFKITDSGGDGAPTLIDRIIIPVAGTAGTAAADFTNARLYRGATLEEEAATITNSAITFGNTAANNDSAATVYSLADGTSQEFTLYVYLPSAKLACEDHETFTFDINETNITADQGTSSQMASDSGAITLSTATVTVTVTYMQVVNQADGAETLSVTPGLSYQLQVRATDAYKNIDKDYTAGFHYLMFSGPGVIGGYTPRMEGVNVGSLNTTSFANGVSAADALTLVAYKAETVNLTAAEYVYSGGWNNIGYSTHALALTVSCLAANSIAIVSGNNQRGAANTELDSPFTVVVKDQYQNPVVGEEVTFTVTVDPSGGGASLSEETPDTNSSGQAGTYLTFGSAGGDYSVQANYSGGTPVTFTALSLTPNALTKTTGRDDQTATVMEALPLPLQVKLVNVSGIGVPGETITFTIISTPPGMTAGTATLSVPSATTDADGFAATVLTVGDKAQEDGYIVQASHGGGARTANFTATATAAAPNKVVLTGDTSVKTGEVSEAFTAKIYDYKDNITNIRTATTRFTLSGKVGLVPSTTVSFYDNPSGSGTPITYVDIPVGSNTAVFYVKDTTTSTLTVGVQRTSGDVLTTPTATVDMSVIPHDLSYFKVSGDTATLTAGGTRTLTVTAYDVHNNVKTNLDTENPSGLEIVFSGASTSASPSSKPPTCSESAAVGGADVNFGSPTTLLFTNGVTTTTLKIYKAEDVAIKATCGSVTTSAANDLNFTVRHAAADHLSFTGNIQTPAGGFVVGTVFSLPSLKALDLYDNLCDGLNGGTVFAGNGKVISYTLSGTANAPDGSATDSYVTSVDFSAGVSTTALTATLYRAQTTTITPKAPNDLPTGTNIASNSITVAALGINKLSFYTQPGKGSDTRVLTNVAFGQQPVVAVADRYGNPVTASSGQITLSGSLSGVTDTPVSNGTLSANALVVDVSGGVATFSGVKYSYPESIYLKATANEGGVSPVFSNLVAVVTAQDDATIAAGSLSEPATISSAAYTNETKVAVYDFKVMDAGADGYATKIKQIRVTRNTPTDTTGGWSSYVGGVTLSDGATSTLGTITDNALTFGAGTNVFSTVANGGYRTYTLSIYLKANLPADADSKVMSFDVDPNDDITVTSTPANPPALDTTVGSGFAAMGSITSASTVDVIATKFKLTSATTAIAAGTVFPITITATDINSNTDLGFDATQELVFSGASVALSGDKPKAMNYSEVYVDFGEVTLVAFTDGVNSSTVNLKLFKAEGAAVKATTSDTLIATAATDDLEVVVTGGAASRLSWYTQPTANVVANAPWNPFSVSVSDAYRNVSPNNVAITITPTGATTTAGSTATVTAQSGIATFSNYTCYSVTGTYPATVTLNATATGLTESGASNSVEVVGQYYVRMRMLDSVNGSALTDVTLEILDAASGLIVVQDGLTNPMSGNSPFSFYLPYGNYQFAFTKDAYVPTTVQKVCDVDADFLDTSYDNSIAWTTYIMSVAESLADYRVMSNFIYDESSDKLNIVVRLEKRGQVIVSNAINVLGTATLQIFDGTTSIGTLTDTTADGEGNYWFTIENATTQVPTGLSKIFTAGRTYYARINIGYGGESGDKTTYWAGSTFTITVTQSLNILTGQIASLSTDIATQVTGVQATVATQAATTRAAVADVKSDATKILTATGTTLPAVIAASDAAIRAKITSDTSSLTSKIDTETSAIDTKLDTAAKSAILTRDSIVMLGSTIKIRYRTYPGASPIITVYDPANVARVAAAVMTEVTPGIYEYPVTFTAGWPRGDYSIVCTEPTYGTLDAITISAKSSDIENVAGNVSSIMGSVSNMRDIESKVAAFSSAFISVEENIERAAAAMSGIKTGSQEAAEAADQLYSLYNSLKEMSAKIQELGGTVGYDLQKLYEVNESRAQDIGYIRNKTQELKAMMSLNQQMIENAAKEEPVVQTWFEFR